MVKCTMCGKTMNEDVKECVACGRKIFTVGKDDECDFKSIQNALDTVEEESVVNVKPGIYKEHLKFKRKVHLCGIIDSMDNKASSELPIVVLDSSKSCEINVPIEVEGIVFTHETDIQFNDLNSFMHSRIEFQNIEYTDIDFETEGFSSLLWVKSNCKLSNITILCASTCGITFSEKSALLENSTVFHSYSRGIYVVNDSAPTISNCKIFSSKGNGVRCINNASIRMESCEIFNNMKEGITSRDKSVIQIENCKIFNNKDEGKEVYGLFCCNDSKLNINKCEIYGHYNYGIVMIENVSGTIENCYIHDNIDCAGVRIQDSVTIQINNCDLINNETYGIAILGSATPIISNCRFMYNKKQEEELLPIGIACGGNSNAFITTSEISNLSCGVFVMDYAKGIIENCKIHSNNQYGINFMDAGNISVRNCEIFNNKFIGVNVAEKGNANINTCNIYGNVKSGLWVDNQACLKTENCKIHKNDVGITCEGNSKFMIINNEIHENDLGSYIRGDSSGTYESCAVLHNKWGFFIEHNSNPLVSRCQIHDNEVGLFIRENGKGIPKPYIDSCEIYNQSSEGIHLSGDVSGKCKNCNIFNNSGYAIQGFIFTGDMSFEGCKKWGNLR